MAARDLTATCSIARALDVVGDRWTVLVLRDALYGVRRFDDFVTDLGIARNVLTDRLGKLVAAGLLRRMQYEERPPRFEYRLTDKGRAFLPVLLTLWHWGEEWASDAPAPVRLEHATCGHQTHAEIACSACHEPLAWRDLRLDPPPLHAGATAPTTDQRRDQRRGAPHGAA